MANQAEVDKLIALLAKTETVAEDVAAVQQILDANPGIAREKGVSEDVEQGAGRACEAQTVVSQVLGMRGVCPRVLHYRGSPQSNTAAALAGG